MATIHPVQVYYDANGNRDELIISDDDGYSPSERPGMARVEIPRATYNALPADLNIAGLAVAHDLNKACVPVLLLADPVRGAKLQTNIAAIDAKIAADAKALSDAKAASLAVWNSYPAVYQQFLLSYTLDADPPTLAQFLAQVPP